MPTYITEKGRFYGAKSNYAGEDIDGSTCRNIYNLPPGYYMLHEDAELALARGYLPAIDHYYEITDNQLEYEFVIQNVRGGLSLQKPVTLRNLQEQMAKRMHIVCREPDIMCIRLGKE